MDFRLAGTSLTGVIQLQSRTTKFRVTAELTRRIV
jgi:hypothetical protein